MGVGDEASQGIERGQVGGFENILRRKGWTVKYRGEQSLFVGTEASLQSFFRPWCKVVRKRMGYCKLLTNIVIISKTCQNISKWYFIMYEDLLDLFGPICNSLGSYVKLFFKSCQMFLKITKLLKVQNCTNVVPTVYVFYKLFLAPNK